MAKDPAVLFYTSDFLAGTVMMNNEERGAYIKLLCVQHQSGHLPESFINKETDSNLVKSKFIKDENGLYYNERMEEEHKKRKRYTESRRNNRKKATNDNLSIYLIENLDTGLIKIGSSNNVDRRIIELKNQYNTENLKIVAQLNNVTQKLEKELHDEYEEYNHSNEWFELTKEQVKEITETHHMIKHMNNHIINDMENENENRNRYGNYNRVLLTKKQYNKLVKEFGESFIKLQIDKLDEYLQTNDNKNKYKDFNLVLRKSIREGWFKVEKVPEWFNAEIKSEKASDEELEEINKMLDSI